MLYLVPFIIIFYLLVFINKCILESTVYFVLLLFMYHSQRLIVDKDGIALEIIAHYNYLRASFVYLLLLYYDTGFYTNILHGLQLTAQLTLALNRYDFVLEEP